MGPRTIAGRYALEEPLGSSSWRATDLELERQVLVRLGAAGETASALLSHPSIARVFDQGEADGEHYTVLEFLPGGTLEERLPELNRSEAQAVAADVAAALEYAHAQGVVHGSLSLASILFDGEGRAKVVGFGGSGTPEKDVLALDSILASLAQVAPAQEELTAVLAPPPASAAASRRSLVLAAVAALTLLLAGVGAAFLATRDSTSGDLRTGSLSVPVPTETADETEAPPSQPATSETESTTTATTATEPEPTTAPTTPQPPTTTAPLPLPPTTVELPPATTEEPAPPLPTTTELPPPPTETDG